MSAVALEARFRGLAEPWSPKVVARVNDQYVKVARVQGSFTWHAHEEEDELFLVMKGRLRIEMEDREPVVLGPGELFVVPRGVRHNPVAEEETWVVLVEPVATKHTGDVQTPLTRTIEEQLEE